MAAPSGSVVIIDPDGDLVLLLGSLPSESPNLDIPSASKTSSTNSTATSIFNPPPATLFGAKPVSILGEEKSIETQSFESTNPNQLYESRILVSSKHMSLASPVFKAMLQGGFHEAIELKKTGKTEIPLPDDDSTAMVILIDIIHGRFKSVPKTLNLATLTQMAILVDKYQCHESTELLRAVWATNISQRKIWIQDWYNTACWIGVAWVFDLHAEFKEATESIIKGSGTGLSEILEENELQLPIPEEVIDTVDERRQHALSQLIEILKDTISKYRGPTLICPTTTYPLYQHGNSGPSAVEAMENITSHRKFCDTLVLGSLVKSAVEHDLFPLPQVPLDRFLTVSGLKERISSLDIMTGCNKAFKGNFDHNILIMLEKSMEFVESNISGLDLADFKKAPRNT
ncbi:hypothetical protein NHQ30_002274 [Ciborinia camelliae]|nr:hypothetical protein NHQ30_002274 [Ciborinia camelliae]